jgi:hypothetical protein
VLKRHNNTIFTKETIRNKNADKNFAINSKEIKKKQTSNKPEQAISVIITGARAKYG